jgi:hypothetical protein
LISGFLDWVFFLYLFIFEPISITFKTFDGWLGGERLFANFVLEHGDSPNFAYA